MQNRLSALTLSIINAYWFGLAFMWNSLHVIILPAVLLAFVPEGQKNTYLGLMTFTGLIIAMIVQPLSGSLSDSWASRWGRRRPLILLGTLGDFIFLALLGWAGGLPMLAAGYIGLQFTSNIAHGPAQGLIPDLVPQKQIGVASGVKNLMDMGGLVVASLAMGRLVPVDMRQASVPVTVVMFVLAAAAAVTLLWTHERPTADAPEAVAPKPVRPNLNLDPRSLLSDLRSQPAFARLILGRFLFLAGVYAVQSFVQYYVRDVLAVPNPVKLTGDLMAIIAVALIALAMTGGWLGDRIGHRQVQLIASVVACIGSILLIWARTPTTLMVFGGIFGMGIGLFLTANWALANSAAPPDQAGKFMGLTNLATAGAGATARLIGPLIDWGNALSPGLWWGYVGMFIFSAVFALASIFFVKKSG